MTARGFVMVAVACAACAPNVIVVPMPPASQVASPVRSPEPAPAPDSRPSSPPRSPAPDPPPQSPPSAPTCPRAEGAAEGLGRSMVVSAAVRRFDPATGHVDASPPGPLSPRGLVRAGDEVVFNVYLDDSAYVYVVYVDAQGVPARMFPKRGDDVVRCGDHRVPVRPVWWTISPGHGTESFVITASPAPVRAIEDRAVAAAAQVVARGADAGKAGSGRAPRRPASQTVQLVSVPDLRTTRNTEDDDRRAPRVIVDGVVATPDPEGVMTAVFAVEYR